MSESAQIVLAGGCFWGTEAFLRALPGVLSTCVGYANGHEGARPQYDIVCTGETGFAEAVRVDYVEGLLPTLLEAFFATIDPCAYEQQGGDIGNQYRTGIYYQNEAQEVVARTALYQLQEAYSEPLRVELEPLRHFYPAEEYHQAYLLKNPSGYCHVNLGLLPPWQARMQAALEGKAPQAPRFVRPSDAVLRETLSPLSYWVTQEGGTERPFENPYYNEQRPGIYVDITTGEPLFASKDKFDSGCGWPAFARPLSPDLLAELDDHALGRKRTEVRSRQGNAHLGHVFEDGPEALGGLRYCINSAALRFIPYEAMEAEGYGAFMAEVDACQD